jgi:homoserine O-acetyltransferase
MLTATRFACSLAVLLLLLRVEVAVAHTAEQPAHQHFEEGDLKLESGEVIKSFAISYVTHGTLNDNKTNAILMTSSIAGNHHRIDFLIGPGKALDTNKYFIIATDAIGNGLSSSPSNSSSQHGIEFPHFLKDLMLLRGSRASRTIGSRAVSTRITGFGKRGLMTAMTSAPLRVSMAIPRKL